MRISFKLSKYYQLMFQPAKLRSSSLLMQTSISLGTLRCIGVGELTILFECFSLISVLYKSTVPSQTVIF